MEVRVWDTVVGSADINARYGTELAGTESNLIAYYPFESLGGAAAVTTSVFGDEGLVY